MTQTPEQSGSTARRLVPLVLLVAATVLAYGLGWHKLLSFETIGLHYEALRSFIGAHIVTAVLLYVMIYVAVVALSLPGGLVMTVSGGLLFGWQLAFLATVVAATIGATIIFLIARTSVGRPLVAKMGPWVERLSQGFRENALSYMLFLRLVPLFPFFIVNLVPALLNVPLKTFVVGTFFGIMPATLAFSVAGSGLGSVIEAQNQLYKACLETADEKNQCAYAVDAGALITPELIAAFVLLGIVALIPVAVKKWNKRHAEK
jgi:uncharacterized membrane protein YdjX (TVP38/TMEM64 family)